MNLQEAFEELGVTPSTTARDARRAYLRLVKTRSPEVDPAGFARLREAYEVVRLVAADDLVASTDASPPVQARTVTVVRVDPPPEPVVEPAVEAPPFDATPPESTEPQAPASTRAPADPSPAPRPPEDRGPTLHALIASCAFVDAAPLLVVETDAAIAEHRSACVPPSTLVRVVLELYASGAPSPAYDVATAIKRYADATGGEARMFGAKDIAAWLVIGELSGLGAALDPALREPMARAVAQVDPSRAYPRLQMFSARDPARARAAVALLAASAPTLSKMFGPSLTPIEAPPAPAASSKAPWAIVPVLVVLLRIVLLVGRSTEPPRSTPPSASQIVRWNQAREAAQPGMSDDEQTLAAMRADIVLGDCASARRRYQALEAKQRSKGLPPGPRLESIERIVLQACPSTSP